MNTRLRFAIGNAKLEKDTAIFSLPAGWTCPGAKLCLSKVTRDGGKLTDGKHTQFRCYAASSENLFRNVREGRWNNFDKLKGKPVFEMVELINRSLPKKCKLVRLHQSGDFFSQSYFDAWIEVAWHHPEKIFYGYTKALPFLVARLDRIPPNFRMVASRGGMFDALIDKHKLRSVTVVFTEQQAKDKGLALDHDDTLVWKTQDSFALLLHGTQPAGSEAGKAWHMIKTKGKGGYKSEYFAHYERNANASKHQKEFKKKRRQERLMLYDDSPIRNRSGVRTPSSVS